MEAEHWRSKPLAMKFASQSGFWSNVVKVGESVVKLSDIALSHGPVFPVFVCPLTLYPLCGPCRDCIATSLAALPKVLLILVSRNWTHSFRVRLSKVAAPSSADVEKRSYNPANRGSATSLRK
jgi:hypothetical protein